MKNKQPIASLFLLQLNKRYKTEELNAFIDMKSHEFTYINLLSGD